jgi:UDP-GlcNAc3NAcA epimerase
MDSSIKKIITILGARPQFIKASAVSDAIAVSGRLREVVVHTGQHFDANMSDVFFAELGMQKPAYHLDIHGGSHGEMTGRMLIEIEKVLLAERPDAVLVYGDTNSTLAGALAAVKLHIPVAHVEAGLRSFNMSMPEEINRILTDRVSQWLFTPTEAAAAHLLREGVESHKIVPVGDVMFDVALRQGAAEPVDGILGKLPVQPGKYCLATIHRAENTDHPGRLAAIVEALTAFSAQTPVIWPLHPRTRAVLAQQGKLDALAKKVNLIDPVGYVDMVQLEKNAALIATDSGGVQKEAFFYQVPCVTLRDETEWVELVTAGWNRLAPPVDAAAVLAALRASCATRGADVAPYGKGDAAQRIVQRLLSDLN